MLNNLWIVICEGTSLKPHIEEVKRIAKKYTDTTIGVNLAPIVFPCKYWCFMDNCMWECAYAHHKPEKIYIAASVEPTYIPFREKNPKIIHLRNQNGCSGNAAIAYAIQQGAKNIITAGHDLTQGWEHYNGRPGKQQSDAYIQLCRRCLRDMVTHNDANIYSLDKENVLNLPVYDISKL